MVTAELLTPTLACNASIASLALVSSAYMGFAHGSNDAQKIMGIIALSLVAATKAGDLQNAPAWLEFLKHPMVVAADGTQVIAPWIKILSALS